MARASLTAQQVTTSGLNPSFVAAVADGDVFDAGRVALWVENGSGSSITITIPTPATVSGLAVADAGGAVPAGAARLFGPFPRTVYGQPAGDANEGRVHVNYSAVTDVTRALITI